MKRRLDIWFLVLTAALAAAVSAVAGKCAFDRRVRLERRTMMTVGVEDVSRRIAETRANLAAVTQLYDASAVAAARTLAAFVEREPAILADRVRFENLAPLLGVDELHVSDGKGRLVASLPREYAGYDMASSAQSAAFLPAITNRAFELVQKPMRKGADGKLFQYAGVARRDAPGIVQVGFSPEKLEAATAASRIDGIAETARLGSGSRVYILPAGNGGGESGRRAGECRFTERWRNQGERVSALEADCGDHRILVTMPLYGWRLADAGPYRAVVVLMYVLWAALVALVIVSLVYRGTRGFARAFREAFDFGGTGAPGVFAGRSSGRTTLRTALPVLSGAAAVFVIGLLAASFAITAFTDDHAAEILDRAAVELDRDIMESPDGMLYFVGSAITGHYRTPEKAAETDVKELMHRYGIDELNIVDSRGVVIKGDLATEGFDFHSNSNTIPFLGLLKNDRFLAQPFRAAVEDPAIVRKYAGIAFPGHNGFVQIGYSKTRMERGLDYKLAGIGEALTVGETGYAIIARRATGEIVSCGRAGAGGLPEARTLAAAGFDAVNLPDDPSMTFEQTLFGERCLCASRLVGDYHRIVVAMPFAEVNGSVTSALLVIGCVLFAVILLAALVTLWFTGVNRRLRVFIEEDRRHREKDMMIAKTVQISSLPIVFPDCGEYTVSARMETAREVGGDFFDFYSVPSGKLLLLVADTSGKGIPAAMFMMKAKAVIKACAFEIGDFAEAITAANDRLAENNDAMMFVTAWFALFDTATGRLEYINCGHNPPVIRHEDGGVTWLRGRSGPPLAVAEGVPLKVMEASLEPGDSLLLYTDGVTEAMDPEEKLYGEPRLGRTVAAAGADGIIDAVFEDVRRHAAGTEQSDDITMLVLKRKKV